MNNEPVAWMDYLEHSDVYDLNVSGRGIPLYTHPVKEQDESFDRTASHMVGEYVSYPIKELTLTDEEIYEVWKKAMQEEAKIEYSIYATQLERQPFLYFAKAILRKAQEK